VSELIKSKRAGSPSYYSPYQSACTFCFRVQIRRYVMLSTEQAESKLKFSQNEHHTTRFACAKGLAGEAKALSDIMHSHVFSSSPET
jgi:hypothetical protein